MKPSPSATFWIKTFKILVFCHQFRDEHGQQIISRYTVPLNGRSGSLKSPESDLIKETLKVCHMRTERTTVDIAGWYLDVACEL